MPSARRFRVAPTLGLLMSVLVLSTAASVPAEAADQDCSDFASQKAAQIFFLQNGGPASDPDRLDSDGDGIACESNPGPYYYGTSLTSSAIATGPSTLRQGARVVKVVDGDTLTVRLDGGARRKVRLIGIDTPEVYGTVECGGRKASASMHHLAPPGTRIVLVSDPTQARVDRYGRLLRYVMRSGHDLDLIQVARGWAPVYVYHHTPFKRVAAYRTAQRQAKSAHRGIWGMCR